MNDHDFLFKVIVVGQSNVGKTSLLHRYVDQTFPDSHYATIGVDYKIKTIQTMIKGLTKTTKLQLWDTAGQERFQSMTSTYFRGANAVILVFALNDVKSFERLTHWITTVEDHKIEFKVLVGNKCDLFPHAISREQVDAFCREHAITLYTETSAKTGQRVAQAFEDMAQKLAERTHVLQEARKQSPLVVSAQPTTNQGGGSTKCCGGTG